MSVTNRIAESLGLLRGEDGAGANPPVLVVARGVDDAIVSSKRAPSDGPVAPPIHLALMPSGLNAPIRPTSVTSRHAATGSQFTSIEADTSNAAKSASFTDAGSGR